MNKEFVTYEIALAMKELGFGEACLGMYYEHNKEFEFLKTPLILQGKDISAPLYQQAFRWFRENYKLHHSIIYLEHKKQYLTETEGTAIYFDETEYEEAQDACLRKLIEIVKENV